MKVKADREGWIFTLCCYACSTRCFLEMQVANLYAEQELRITPLHIKLRATGGSKTKTPSSGAQAALKALARSGMKIGRIRRATTN
ncbi:hypothetical protein GOBAR_AA13384 [Gossypium barbadense]|uniref:40S ribosomal protein S14 n=1 Tax=Gossypium barbadense TaxID=3634 RepID=A0A2P5XV85_GOSBA|nr:hypothetical protein GOBAR_AA13384 [Gossypium barbadense]